MSNKKGIVTFYDVPETNQTSASLSPDKLKNSSSFTGEVLEYEVETMTISELIEERKIDLRKRFQITCAVISERSTGNLWIEMKPR